MIGVYIALWASPFVLIFAEFKKILWLRIVSVVLMFFLGSTFHIPMWGMSEKSKANLIAEEVIKKLDTKEYCGTETKSTP